MLAKTREAGALGRLISYAQVPTEEQCTDPRRDKLHAADCGTMLQQASDKAVENTALLAGLC